MENKEGNPGCEQDVLNLFCYSALFFALTVICPLAFSMTAGSIQEALQDGISTAEGIGIVVVASVLGSAIGVGIGKIEEALKKDRY